MLFIKTTSSSFLRRCFLSLSALLFCTLAVQANDHAIKDTTRHVLILHSYHHGLSWTDSITEGLQETIRAQYPPEALEIHIEYMNTKRFPLESQETLLYDLLKRRYADLPLDVIIACDNNAYDFLKKYRPSLFSNLPVIFCGLNDFDEEQTASPRWYTGVAEHTDPALTLDLMREIHPNIERCIVIVDGTVTGQREQAAAKRKLGPRYFGIDIEYWQGPPVKELKQSLQKLDPERDSVLLVLYNRDADSHFFSYRESAKIISENTRCPVYGLWDFYLGTGIFGGHMVRGWSQGEKAAKLALSVLSGTPPSNIPIVEESPNYSLLDAKVLAEWGIRYTSLPAGIAIMDRDHLVYKTGESTVLRLGILARDGQEACREQWGPFVDYLTRTVSRFAFEIAPLTFDEIMEAVHSKEIDFLLTNPMQYVELSAREKIAAIATMNNRSMGANVQQFGGVIFTRTDRKDIRDLDDLKHRQFGAVHPLSFGGWLSVKYEMVQAGLYPEKDLRGVSFFGTHSDVVRAVLDGTVDAGCVRTNHLERMQLAHDVSIKDLHIINEKPRLPHFPFRRSTALYPEWPIAMLPHVPDDIDKEVVHALLTLEADHPAAKQAKIAGWTSPLSYISVQEALITLGEGYYAKLSEPGLWDTLLAHWPWAVGFLLILLLSLLFTLYVSRLNQSIRAMANRLRVSEELHRLMFEKNRTVQLLINPENMQIVDANPAAVDYYGYPKEQLIGMPMNMINTLSPAEIKTEMQAVIEEKQSYFQFRHRLASGEVRHVEVHSSPFTSGEQSLLFSIVHDITDRVLAQEQLRQSEEKMQNILEQVTDVIWSLTWPDLTVNYISPSVEEVFGYTEQYFKDNPNLWMEIVVPEDRASVDRAFQDLEEKDKATREYRAIRADGEVVWIRDTSKFIRDPQGNIIRLDGITSDISESKEREETRLMLEREEQRSRRHSGLMTMAAAFAHNFNNSLQVVMGYINLIKDSAEENSNVHQDAQKALQSAEKAVSMSTLMLLYVGQGQKRQACDLQEILLTQKKNMEIQIAGAHRLECDIQEGLDYRIQGDWKWLSEAIWNVLINAIESLPETGGRVQMQLQKISLSRGNLEQSRIPEKPLPGEFFSLNIKDAGKGMDMTTQDRMFEPFFTTHFTGRGVGLAAVYGVMLGHGGAIFTETEPEKGTSISLCFPVPPS